MKETEYQKELAKMRVIFAAVDPNKAALVDGLIQDAAFLKVQNDALREGLAETGMVKIHPQHKNIQKPIEAARQYRQSVNSYAVIIKTLNGILHKDALETDDPFDEFIKEMREEKDE
jgi:hypothetical protein